MLTAFIVIAVIGYVFAVPSPEKKTAPVVVEHHHHHYHVKVERTVYVQAQVQLIQAKIAMDLKKQDLEPVRLPEARALNATTAIERYRSHERKPS